MSVMRCPSCNSTKNLWRGASTSGWVAIDANGHEVGGFETDGFSHEVDDTWGCGACSWESSTPPHAPADEAVTS